MSAHFTKIETCWPRPLQAVEQSGLSRFEPIRRRWARGFSCCAQIGQPFQVPTDTFELQFQPVGFTPRLGLTFHHDIYNERVFLMRFVLLRPLLAVGCFLYGYFNHSPALVPVRISGASPAIPVINRIRR
jgi:hypothetical protein